MTDRALDDPASPFLERWIRRLAPTRTRGACALDVACGRGRHTRVLAAAGYAAIGIDIRMDALAQAQAASRAAGLQVTFVCADLTRQPLPDATFELVVVSRYLDRERLPAMVASLADGGTLLYETFTDRQLQYARGPRSRAHLLRPGELRALVHGMDVLFDEETAWPAAVARIAARKRVR